MRDDFETRFNKAQKEFEQEWRQTTRFSTLIVYGVMVFYIALVIGALIGCYFLLQAVL